MGWFIWMGSPLLPVKLSCLFAFPTIFFLNAYISAKGFSCYSQGEQAIGGTHLTYRDGFSAVHSLDGPHYKVISP